MAWDEGRTSEVLVNPFYAITFAPILCADHEPLIDRETWIRANVQLIEQLGAERWLRTLLEVLETGGPPSPS
jgi:hypothetical protein